MSTWWFGAEVSFCGIECISPLTLQVRYFDSVHYLKSFEAGDVWVAVGWSSDIIPVAKRMSNVAVVVPKSGASIWADLWVCIIQVSCSCLYFVRKYIETNVTLYI